MDAVRTYPATFACTFESTPSGFRVLLDHVGDLLADHDDRHLGMGRYDLGHDGSVGLKTMISSVLNRSGRGMAHDSETVDAVDFQTSIDDGSLARVRPHGARRCRVVDRLRVANHGLVELGVIEILESLWLVPF